MDIKQINQAIMFGNLTNVELASVIDAVKWARASLTQQSKRSLRIGDSVNFTSTKQGMNVTGLVMKIAIKYVTVKTATGLWRVPANMLTKVEDREFA
jgi:small-conductance mechanosensitive channel